MSNRSVLPLVYPLLLEKASTGAYWELHQHFRQQSARGLESFRKFVGALHQDYATGLLKRAYPVGEEARLVDEAEVIASSPRRPKGQNPPFDAALLSGEDLVLVEMSAIRVHAHCAPAGGCRPVPGRGGEVRGEGAPARRAVDGLSVGTWKLPGLDRSRVRRVFPMMVLLHPYPSFPSTLEPLEAQLPSDVRSFGGSVAATLVNPRADPLRRGAGDA